jgi:hypothetical protein
MGLLAKADCQQLIAESLPNCFGCGYAALCNARRAEGVGLDNVRAGFEKAAIDVADYLRLRQREEVTVVEKPFCGVLEAVPTDVRFAGLSIKSPRA